MKALTLVSFILVGAFLSGCAGHFPVPGGSDTVNKSFYESEDDLKDRIQALRIGMPKQQVFAQLDRQEDHFIILSRSEILSSLYGSSQNQYVPRSNYNYASYGYNNRYSNNYGHGIKSFEGYKLIFKNVEREHGISSPIAMRTDKVGFSYTAVFIFQNGLLYEDPILSGGTVDARSTKTIFDYLSPETVMSRVPI